MVEGSSLVKKRVVPALHSTGPVPEGTISGVVLESTSMGGNTTMHCRAPSRPCAQPYPGWRAP